MASVQTLKQRNSNFQAPPRDTTGDYQNNATTEHPSGKVQHARAVQVLRCLLFVSFFTAGCCTIVATQLIGAPLYWINRDFYYAYMALTKQSFLLLITTITQWSGPTMVRISGDESVNGQIRKVADGNAEFTFPDRFVMIANHQIYTEWLYLWWTAYANLPKMHGHIYIVLKETLKYVPILGQGMMFYGFIFMSRKMEKDKPRLAYRLQKLKAIHRGPLSRPNGFDPMWLILFPEGTNLSSNGRVKSAHWAEKQGIKDMRHQLLPRSAGTFFCLNELKGTIDWVYDCTLAYEGIPQGQYGQDYFTLRSVYLEGRTPKSVNMYWRRFAMSSIPLDDLEKFDLWLRQRWIEKDDLIEQYVTTGRFPEFGDFTSNGSESNGPRKVQNGFFESYIKTTHPWEFFQIFTVLGAYGLVANLLARVWNVAFHGSSVGQVYCQDKL